MPDEAMRRPPLDLEMRLERRSLLSRGLAREDDPAALDASIFTCWSAGAITEVVAEAALLSLIHI